MSQNPNQNQKLNNIITPTNEEIFNFGHIFADTFDGCELSKLEPHLWKSYKELIAAAYTKGSIDAIQFIRETHVCSVPKPSLS